MRGSGGDPACRDLGGSWRIHVDKTNWGSGLTWTRHRVTSQRGAGDRWGHDRRGHGSKIDRTQRDRTEGDMRRTEGAKGLKWTGD